MFKWLEFDILLPDDRYDLERNAAISQMEGMPQVMAEQAAYQKYIYIQHLKAAAHHLMGMIENKFNGSMSDSHKHYGMYVLHLNALKINPHDTVHPSVVTHQPIGLQFNSFLPHPADVLIKV